MPTFSTKNKAKPRVTKVSSSKENQPKPSKSRESTGKNSGKPKRQLDPETDDLDQQENSQHKKTKTTHSKNHEDVDELEVGDDEIERLVRGGAKELASEDDLVSTQCSTQGS